MTLYKEYQATGSIKACKHSTAQLQAAENAAPPDIVQYSPDFLAALQSALQARAHGDCGGAAAVAAVGPTSSGPPSAGAPGGSAPAVSGTAPGATPAPLSSPMVASPIAQAATHVDDGGASSAPLMVLAIVLIVVACAAIWWTLTTLRGGHESPRLSSAGHSLGEMRLRAGETLREFADWLRLGR